MLFSASVSVYNECFLIQLGLLLRGHIPKSGTELTPEELAFITEAKPIYGKHLQQSKLDTFMDPEFLLAYHKTESRSQALSLETLQPYLLQLKKTQQILIMSCGGYAHCIGVPKLKTILFDEDSQKFVVQRFNNKTVYDWIEAIKKTIISWNRSFSDDRIQLQFMSLVSLN